MSYKFLHITGLYSGQLDSIQINNPDINNYSYQMLLDLMSKQVVLTNCYFNLSKWLSVIGVDTNIIYANFEVMQKKWAMENNVSVMMDKWLETVLIEQVKKIKPDVVFITDLYTITKPIRKEIKRNMPRKSVIAGWRTAMTKDFSLFKDLDIILTAAPQFINIFKNSGVNAALIPLGFESATLQKVSTSMNREIDFSFVGQVGSSKGTHGKRYKLIEELIELTNLTVWGSVNIPHRSLKLKLFGNAAFKSLNLLRGMRISNNLLNKIPYLNKLVDWDQDFSAPSVFEKYSNRFREPVYGLDYLRILANSKLTLNCHGYIVENDTIYAPNLRLFEATGMKACLLTDWAGNIEYYFEPGKEIVVYNNPQDAIEKANYLLNNPKKREAIAMAGQQRTLNYHTNEKRSIVIDKIFKDLLNKNELTYEL